MSIEDFEERIFAQKTTPPEHYDHEYFYSDWREGTNNYTVESRRVIEGKHPEVIRDVFQPERVLDFGCGPGSLLYLLWELDIVGDGVDFSEAAKKHAPAEIRDRILVSRIDTEIPLEPVYDLVICREVIEHLTVHEIQRAVENMCALSTRYVYVTTRFAASDDLLAVEREPDVDPSHISLLNKDFLRLLFVLQGFRSRRDLEARMDWKGYGRLLVMERGR